ncbi:hypothetical protein HZ326_16226 [Fusarium oxysporum f. sp. albedinis]|nr:hypothetical protein HZ326_16226 [Fusarium oxysporum f. sp. albedinis]
MSSRNRFCYLADLADLPRSRPGPGQLPSSTPYSPPLRSLGSGKSENRNCQSLAMSHAKACEKAAEDPDKEHVARARHMQASSSYWKKYAWHHPNYMKLQPLVRTSSRQRQEIFRYPEPCFNWFQQASKTRQDTHFQLADKALAYRQSRPLCFNRILLHTSEWPSHWPFWALRH